MRYRRTYPHTTDWLLALQTDEVSQRAGCSWRQRAAHTAQIMGFSRGLWYILVAHRALA